MSGFVKNATAWSQIKHLSTKVAGNWTPVRKGFVKVNGVWKQFFEDTQFLIYALGLSETVTPTTNRGLWLNGVHSYTSGRSYNVAVFDNLGNVTDFRTFDVFADAGNGNTVNADAMSSYLNGIANGTILAIFSYDEPMNGRLGGALESTMYNLGASYGVFNQSIQYRGAYMLLTKKNPTPTVYAEYYLGTNIANGDPNAAVIASFQIYNGDIINLSRSH